MPVRRTGPQPAAPAFADTEVGARGKAVAAAVDPLDPEELHEGSDTRTERRRGEPTGPRRALATTRDEHDEHDSHDSHGSHDSHEGTRSWFYRIHERRRDRTLVLALALASSVGLSASLVLAGLALGWWGHDPDDPTPAAPDDPLQPIQPVQPNDPWDHVVPLGARDPEAITLEEEPVEGKAPMSVRVEAPDTWSLEVRIGAKVRKIRGGLSETIELVPGLYPLSIRGADGWRKIGTVTIKAGTSPTIAVYADGHFDVEVAP